MAGLSIFVFLFLGIFLLLRYAAITEAKHQVIKLNNQLEQVVNQKEKLKLELEKATKSELIEMEAMSRLNMTYPKVDQTYYITVNPTKVALLTQEMNKQLALPQEGVSVPAEGVMSKVINKFVELFRI